MRALIPMALRAGDHLVRNARAVCAVSALRRRTAVVAVVVTGLVLVLAGCGSPHGGARASTYPGLSSADVSFRGDDGVLLHGTIVAPERASGTGRLPAVVLVQGAGPVGRSEYHDEAEQFAQHGIVALVYDKRTAGYSATHRDYGVLAGDALSAVRSLRARSYVDPARVGIWGLSEGAWVAVLAADRSKQVSYVITAGAVGVSPAEQQAWSYGQFLRHGGVTGSLLSMMRTTGIRQLTAAGLFPEADYDPVPSWEHLRQPVLALWGTLDREAAPRQSARIITAALARGGNSDATIRFVPGARHDLRITNDDGFDRPYGPYPGTIDLESSWIEHQPIAGSTTAPAQTDLATAEQPLNWYENPWLQLFALLLFAAAYAGYPMLGLVGRLARSRRRSRRRTRHAADVSGVGASTVAVTAHPARRAARLTAALGAATVLGGVVYFLFLVLTAAGSVGPVVLGQTVPWIALHLLAYATLVATAVSARITWRHRAVATPSVPARLQLVLLMAAGTVLLPWAFYWGLLTF